MSVCKLSCPFVVIILYGTPLVAPIMQDGIFLRNIYNGTAGMCKNIVLILFSANQTLTIQ